MALIGIVNVGEQLPIQPLDRLNETFIVGTMPAHYYIKKGVPEVEVLAIGSFLLQTISKEKRFGTMEAVA